MTDATASPALPAFQGNAFAADAFQDRNLPFADVVVALGAVETHFSCNAAVTGVSATVSKNGVTAAYDFKTTVTGTKAYTYAGKVLNYAPYSEQFGVMSELSWMSVIDNTTTDPLGGNTADTLMTNRTGYSSYVIYSSLVCGPGVTVTCSVYLKAYPGSAGNVVGLMLESPARDFIAYAVWNVATGTFVTSAGGVTSTACTDAGGGWYRCSMTLTVPKECNTLHIRCHPTIASPYSDASFRYVTVGHGAYFWGRQLVIGPLTPYSSSMGLGWVAQGVVDINADAAIGVVGLVGSATAGDAGASYDYATAVTGVELAASAGAADFALSAQADSADFELTSALGTPTTISDCDAAVDGVVLSADTAAPAQAYDYRLDPVSGTTVLSVLLGTMTSGIVSYGHVNGEQALTSLDTVTLHYDYVAAVDGVSAEAVLGPTGSLINQPAQAYPDGLALSAALTEPALGIAGAAFPEGVTLALRTTAPAIDASAEFAAVGLVASASVDGATTRWDGNAVLTGVELTTALQDPGLKLRTRAQLKGVRLTSAVGSVVARSDCAVTVTGVVATTSLGTTAPRVLELIYPTGAALGAAIEPVATTYSGSVALARAPPAQAALGTVLVRVDCAAPVSGVTTQIDTGSAFGLPIELIRPAGVALTTSLGAQTLVIHSYVFPTGTRASVSTTRPKVKILANLQLLELSSDRYCYVPEDDRTLVVPDNPRRMLVPTNDRVMSVAFVDRSSIIPSENRVLRVPAEDRAMTVRAQPRRAA